MALERPRYTAGDRIDDRYEVRELLGNGAAAEVYRATDCRTGCDVVLKLPHVTLAGDLAAFNRYQREIEILRDLHHPHLQHLLVDPGVRYMVYTYIQGESLRAYLSRHGQLSVDETLRIGLQLAEVLEYVHGRGVIHRDLKPDNILIGSDGHITLTDFGIAVRWGGRGLSLSHLANAVGTPDYMAPEQLRGQRGDVRTDVYGLGCVLFELLTGRVPYPTGDKALDESKNLPLLRRFRPDAPPAFEAVLYRAIRRRPEERYPSIAAMAHDLANLDAVAMPVAYLPDVAAPPPLGDLPPWRTTFMVLAIILVVLVLLGAVAQFAHRAPPSP